MGEGWLKEYERILLTDPRLEAFQQAVELKARNLPQSLFRYREVSEWNLDTLARGYVWLSPPRLFNDPYDTAVVVDQHKLAAALFRKKLPDNLRTLRLEGKFSKPEIDLILNSKDPHREFGRLLFEHDAKHSVEDANRFLDVVRTAVEDEAKELDRSIFGIARQLTKVCCFCSRGTVPALWAHYSKNGTGFCIEYDLTKIPPDDIRLRLLVPVIYGKAPIDLTDFFAAALVQGPNAFTVRWPIVAASYKDQDWSYEREWRLVNTFGDPSPGLAVMMPVKAVHLGVEIDAKDAAKVVATAKTASVPVFRMQLGPDASQLLAVPED